MAFNLTGISQWKDERLGEIIYKPFELDNSLNYFAKVRGVKGQKVLLPVLDVNPTIDFTNACGFGDTSQAQVAQVEISAPQQKAQLGLCLRAIKETFLTQALPSTENPDTFDWIDEIVARLLQQVSRRMSTIMWLGDSTLTSYPADFQAYDGLLTKLTGVPPGQQHTLPSGQVITSSNVISVFDKVIENLPTSAITNQPIVFCGSDVFRILVIALRNQNYFHYNPEITANAADGFIQPIVYPGTNVLVVPTLGLNSNNVAGQVIAHKQRIIATYRENFIFGYNVSLDEVDVWYSQDADEVRMRYAYHAGVAVKFVDLVSEFHLTP